MGGRVTAAAATANSSLRRRVEVAHALAERHASRSLSQYLRQVVINSTPEPRRFGQIADVWQLDLADRIVPALESAAGMRHDYRGPLSFWLTLPRGHDKTGLIGRLLNGCLAFSRRRLSLYTAAGDSDQAGLIAESMESERRMNPWLERRISPGRFRMTGPGGTLKVLSADAPSSFGLTGDVFVLDEPTHWKKRELFDVLWSGREKRTGSVWLMIANAGLLGSWQHDLLLRAKASPDWYVFETPPGRQLASWMSPERIAEMRRMLPRGLARRVLDNVWIDPAEESDYLTRAEIEACEQLGRELGLTYTTRGTSGVRYVAGIDYGPRRDRTALCVLHRDGSGRVLLDRLDVWQGSPEAPVLIQRVEQWMRDIARDFPGVYFVCDPYQLEGTIQDFERHHEVERFEARGGKRNYEMAETFRSLVSSKQLAWYPGAGTLVKDGRQESFADEAAGLVLKTTPYGYRFDHEAGMHDDRTVAVGMAALTACRMDPSRPGVAAPEIPKQRPRPVESRQDRAGTRGLWGRGL